MDFTRWYAKYLHCPEELIAETPVAGFVEVALFAIEGPMWLTPAAKERWNDPVLRERCLTAIR